MMRLLVKDAQHHRSGPKRDDDHYIASAPIGLISRSSLQ